MRMSTRFTSADGMKFRSAAVSKASPDAIRRPLSRERVRTEPSWRNATVAVPDAPLEIVEFWAAKTCGSCWIRSSTRPVPW